jgi:glycogen debranching enzyme
MAMTYWSGATPRGCPFQAWSLGEVLRLAHTVLREEGNMPAVTRTVPPASKNTVQRKSPVRTTE